MPKYYVQSGEMSRLVQAKDSMSAAVWSAHLHLEKQLSEDFWENSNPEDPDTIENEEFIDALACFEESMRVSEIGFGRDEAGDFSTIDVLTEWNQLVIALCRFEDEHLGSVEDAYIERIEDIRDVTDQM